MKLKSDPEAAKTVQIEDSPAVVHERLVRRLVEARENIRWTQADLAKATGLQPAAISHFECGQRLPSLPNAVKLADALRVSLDWLTGRNDGVPNQHPFVEIDGVAYYPSPNA
jgi:transcriptional regulator with XRE-family HTH domain